MPAKEHPVVTAVSHIIADSLFWHERLETATGGIDEEVANSYLAEWGTRLDKDKPQEAWQKFLAWSELNLAQVKRALSPLEPSAPLPKPVWATILQEAFSLANTSTPRCINPEKPRPFEALLYPFVHIFQQRLETHPDSRFLTTTAQIDLERDLLHTLTQHAAPTLYAEFQLMRRRGASPLLQWLPQQGDEQTLYNEFVQSGQLQTHCLKYPVLGRMLATLTHLWIESQLEFISRLAADWQAIEAIFGQGEPLPYVQTVKANLSDRHHNGRTVISLTFSPEFRLIYKPKHLGLDVAFNELVAWVNEQELPLELKPLPVLNRPNYGWVTYAEHLPCVDETAVRRFYKRAGMLLALLHVLQGSDAHVENIIAWGEYPILIDMETLLHHDVPPEQVQAKVTKTALFKAHQLLNRSVIRTHYLPFWVTRLGQDVTALNLGGLGGQIVAPKQQRWQHINSDQMRLVTVPSEPEMVKQHQNLPLLAETPVPLTSYEDEILSGFAHMYRLLLNKREAFVAGPLRHFQKQQVRFVFRATKSYGQLLEQLKQPRYMRDGLRYSLWLEGLAQAFVLHPHKPSSWHLLAVERQAISRWDVPLIVAQVDSDTLDLGADGILPTYFEASCYQQVLTCLHNLSEADLAFQLRITRLALLSNEAELGTHVSSLLPEDAIREETAVSPLLPDTLVTQAELLAEQLAAQAIVGEDGSMTWLSLQFSPTIDQWQLGLLPDFLYDGLAGVALFWAGLAKVTGQDRYHALSLATLQSVRTDLQDMPSPAIIGGAASGLGSLLYVLVRVGQWLSEPSLLAEAQMILKRLTPAHIEADTVYDVIGGTAGAILGLLTMYEATENEQALKLAVACGEHLQKTAVTQEVAGVAWLTTKDNPPLAGFSHGVAGIAYALWRLSAVIGNTALETLAQQAIEYERTLFVAEQGNWLDLREHVDSENGRFMTAWCHGAPGIALARLGSLPFGDDPAIHQEIEVALHTTQKMIPNAHLSPDHLCCGNMGRVAILLTAGQLLDRPELIQTAQQYAVIVLNRAMTQGHFKLRKDESHPGFFNGISGIGYTLLRLAYPDLLPSVLLWA